MGAMDETRLELVAMKVSLARHASETTQQDIERHNLEEQVLKLQALFNAADLSAKEYWHKLETSCSACRTDEEQWMAEVDALHGQLGFLEVELDARRKGFAPTRHPKAVTPDQAVPSAARGLRRWSTKNVSGGG